METQSSVASWSLRIGLLGVVLVLAGPLLSRLGAPAMTGFLCFVAGGLLLGGVALLLGLIGLVRTRPATGFTGRGQAIGGSLLGAGLVLAVVVAGSAGQGLPQINDITTDPADPPQFVAIATRTGLDLSYPGARFADPQRAAYPDLAPIPAEGPPGQAFQQARKAAVGLGWEIVAEDPTTGRIEASDTTAIFRFVDDVVIRIKPVPGGGVVVDLRSKSRDGRGDLGANAARIRAFRDAFAG